MFADTPQGEWAGFAADRVVFTATDLRFRADPASFPPYGLCYGDSTLARRPETTPLKTFNYSTAVKLLR
jgi:hypothetical protein